MSNSKRQNAEDASHLFEEAILDQIASSTTWSIDRNVARKANIIASLVEVDPYIVTIAIAEEGIRRCIVKANDLRATMFRHNIPTALLEEIPAPVPYGLDTIGGLFARYLDRYPQGMTWKAWVESHGESVARLYAHGRDADWIESIGANCCRAKKGGAA